MANRKDFDDVSETNNVVEPVDSNYSFISMPVSDVATGDDRPATSGRGRKGISPVEIRDVPTEPLDATIVNSYSDPDVTQPIDPVYEESKVIAVVGWLVSIKGACKGQDYRLHSGWNYVGRNKSADVCIPDTKISGEGIIRIGFVDDERVFYVVPCDGARNIAKCNGKSILGVRELAAYDKITVGDTELIFVPLCSEKFTWEE